tara:strand:- start:550 stop:840 length:291 start_codon:yes stop_codon:yes gene_type:complete
LSFIEDDSINGSIIEPIKQQTEEKVRPSTTLRDKLIDYGIKEGEFTKEDLYLNVSSSGVATVIVKSLIQKGIFVEHKFNCNHCKFYTIDKTKINIE